MTTFFSLYQIGGAIQKKSRRARDPNSFVIDKEVSEPLYEHGPGHGRQPEVTGNTFGFNVIKDRMRNKNPISAVLNCFSVSPILES